MLVQELFGADWTQSQPRSLSSESTGLITLASQHHTVMTQLMSCSSCCGALWVRGTFCPSWETLTLD